MDLTFTMDMGTLLLDTLPNMLLKRDEIHGMLLYGIFDTRVFVETAVKSGLLDPGPMEHADRIGTAFADMFVKLPHKYGKPVVGASFFGRNEYNSIRYLQNKGVPFLPTPERAAAALAALRKRAKYLQRINQED